MRNCNIEVKVSCKEFIELHCIDFFPQYVWGNAKEF